MVLERLKCGIIPHPLEVEELREIYFILTYACNKACPYCIEPNVHTNKYMDKNSFIVALDIAKTLGLETIYLSGGEPTVHSDIVKYAEFANLNGFKVILLTNGLQMNVVEKLDGIVDEIRFSYEPGSEFMLMPQSNWKSRINLDILATTEKYPTEDSLVTVANIALKLGMGVKIKTLTPTNAYSYMYQFVPYLHDRLLNIPERNVFCDRNNLAYKLSNGVTVRFGNMQLNPEHLKYHVDPDGILHSRFNYPAITNIWDHEIEAKKILFQPVIDKYA